MTVSLDPQVPGPAEPAFIEQPRAASTEAAPVSVQEESAVPAGLEDQGILTEEEFAAQKARILAL